jgi:hypothetical protein
VSDQHKEYTIIPYKIRARDKGVFIHGFVFPQYKTRNRPSLFHDLSPTENLPRTGFKPFLDRIHAGIEYPDLAYDVRSQLLGAYLIFLFGLGLYGRKGNGRRKNDGKAGNDRSRPRMPWSFGRQRGMMMARVRRWSDVSDALRPAIS